MKNKIKISISIEASIEITDQMKDKIKLLNPYAYNQYKDDDESLALIMFYASMDDFIAKNKDLNEYVKDLKVVTI